MSHKKNPGVLKSIQEFAEGLQDELGVKLVRVEFAGEGGRKILRVIISRDGGVRLDDCEAFSRSLSNWLDEEDLIAEKYYLEVSSPGIPSPKSGGTAEKEDGAFEG